jgi:hypothetical protein
MGNIANAGDISGKPLLTTEMRQANAATSNIFVNRRIKNAVKQYYIQSHMLPEILAEFINIYKKYELPQFSEKENSYFTKEVVSFIEKFLRGIRGVLKKKFLEMNDKFLSLFGKDAEAKKIQEALKKETTECFDAFAGGYCKLAADLCVKDEMKEAEAIYDASSLLKHHLESIMEINAYFRDRHDRLKKKRLDHEFVKELALPEEGIGLTLIKLDHQNTFTVNKPTFLAFSEDKEKYLAVQGGVGASMFDHAGLVFSSDTPRKLLADLRALLRCSLRQRLLLLVRQRRRHLPSQKGHFHGAPEVAGCRRLRRVREDPPSRQGAGLLAHQRRVRNEDPNRGLGRRERAVRRTLHRRKGGHSESQAMREVQEPSGPGLGLWGAEIV